MLKERLMAQYCALVAEHNHATALLKESVTAYEKAVWYDVCWDLYAQALGVASRYEAAK